MSSSGAGRIVVDVGGTKFLTATKTLATNSTYFASLFRGEWSESSAHDGEEDDVFLDQDPVAFGKLLQYMRRGMIKVEDVDIDVLILAEFLGLDKLILAAKVRWYCNIGKGPVISESDEDIAAAFDEVHGGILKAISNGLFPFFLKQDDVNADKDYAVITVDYEQPGEDEVFVDKIVSDASITSIICGRGGIIGACNGLQADGFMSPGRTLNVDATYTGEELMSFSRRRHSSAILTGNATAIFIPTHDEMDKRWANSAKQFAVYVTNGIGNNVEDSVAYIVAPAEFVGGANETVNEVNNISNPYAEVIIRENLEEDGRDRLYYWLVKHNFTTPETWVLENDMFRRWFIDFHSRGFDSKSNIQVFSRPLSLAHQEE
jgi:hypothetical protein